MNRERALSPSLTRAVRLLAVAALAPLAFSSAHAQVLVADTFQGATFDPSAAYLANYQLNGQTGTLKPLTYTMGTDVGANTWRIQLDNGRVRSYGNNQSTTFGYGTDFKYNQMSISVDMNLDGAQWVSLVIGGTAAASQTGAGSFAVRLQASGDINIRKMGTGDGGNSLTFSGVALPNATNTIRVDFTNTAWDGTGTATINVWINGVQLDLDSGGPGMSVVRSGFTDNYISFGTQFPNASLASGYYDNISIAAIPEPRALPFVGLLGFGALVVHRRRKIASFFRSTEGQP